MEWTPDNYNKYADNGRLRVVCVRIYTFISGSGLRFVLKLSLCYCIDVPSSYSVV